MNTADPIIPSDRRPMLEPRHRVPPAIYAAAPDPARAVGVVVAANTLPQQTSDILRQLHHHLLYYGAAKVKAAEVGGGTPAGDAMLRHRNAIVSLFVAASAPAQAILKPYISPENADV